MMALRLGALSLLTNSMVYHLGTISMQCLMTKMTPLKLHCIFVSKHLLQIKMNWLTFSFSLFTTTNGSPWVAKISPVSQVRELRTTYRVAISVFPHHRRVAIRCLPG